MARPRKNPSPAIAGGVGATASTFTSWAEMLGEALGRGVARGINSGLSGAIGTFGAAPAADAPRRRGRPPKAASGNVAADRMCTVPGCGREARSKGLCSRHYQAERRKQLAKK